MPYLRHYGCFVPKVREIGGRVDIYDKQKALNINTFSTVCFFEKSSRVPKVVPKKLPTFSIPLVYLWYRISLHK